MFTSVACVSETHAEEYRHYSTKARCWNLASESTLQTRQFDLVETVVWKFLSEFGEQFFRRVPVVVAQSNNRQQQTGIGRKVTAFLRGDLQIGGSFVFVGLRARQTPHPPCDSRTESKLILFDYVGQLCVPLFR